MKVKTLDGHVINLQMTPPNTLEDVKAAIEEKEGIPRDQQRLISLNVNKELEDDCTLADYNIENDSTLNLLLWMKGLST